MISISYPSHAENDREMARYATYGCAVAEVEVDILTGETQINQCDVVMDVGERLVTIIHAP